MKVLIVDDSQVLARCLRSSLAEVAGLEIVGHSDCVADGILEIRRAKPDVVILDIRMPDGSGIEILEEFEETPVASDGDYAVQLRLPAISKEMPGEWSALLF